MSKEIDKAKELIIKFMEYPNLIDSSEDFRAKECALICVKNEYYSLREQLFNLRACGVIEKSKTYLARLDDLNEQEELIIKEINKQ